MGTSYSVKVVNANLPSAELAEGIEKVLESVNRGMSTYLPESELSKLNQNRSSGWIAVSQELMQVLQLADRVSKESNGAFDITVGPIVNLWGFGPDKKRSVEPNSNEIKSLLARVGHKNLILDGNRLRVKKLITSLYIDLSGVAKGYAVDKVAEYLEGSGEKNYLVEVGGEIRVHGRNKDNVLWRLAVEKPAVDERAIHEIVALNNQAIATSGDYRNYFEVDGKHYSHTINPVTGRPITNRVASVSVITSSAAYADAMATALMVLGEESGVSLANRLKLKVLFLVKQNEGFKEVRSSAFPSPLEK